MDRQERIKALMAQHRLPETIAKELVDAAGVIDQGKLNLALAGVAWGKNPAASADPGLVDALVTAARAAKARGDMAGLISIRRRLAQLGAMNPLI